MSDDPVLVRRASIARWSDLGKRVGYTAYGVAMVIFFVAFATTFTSLVTTAIVALMVGGGLVLIPAIVFGYGVKAAEREEREERARLVDPHDA